MAYLLGIDTSTTATKALLMDDAGHVVAVGSTPHDHSSPRPLWSEQGPDEWWRATAASVRQALAEAGAAGPDVRAVGLTGQMHGLVLLDGAGAVLRPAMLWNDGRAQAQCDEIRERLGGLDALVAETGNDAFAGFTAPKLLWVKEHEPDVVARVAQVLLPKDYLRYRLTGGFATDRAGAGGTLLLDLASRDWSATVLDALDVPADWLPPTHEGPEVTGAVSAQAAEETGLAVGTPVVGGGGDQAATAVGVGAVRPGVWAMSLGTSGVVFAPTDAPHTAPQGRAHAFPHAVPGLWHLMGVMLSAAGSLRWYRDTFAPDTGYDALLAEAAGVAPGSEGLTFLPYLAGERTPHANPLAQGAFVGLTLRHGRGHATRAVLEGVAFGLRDNLELLRQSGVEAPDTVRVAGGGAVSPLWRQILADTLSVALAPVQTPEAAAFGAALLAGVGAGVWPDVATATDATVTVGETTEPGASDLGAAYDRFRDLYARLEPSFPRP
ncbi:xylulokinase [Rubrivirga sp.]|uniref:xylulokinase n=1 Tax=Rubrivirga sp. TaxID=1885344 RepID=UPI003B51FB2C